MFENLSERLERSFKILKGEGRITEINVLNKIIASADITKDDFVLEIGPGIGTMTQYLAEAAGHVLAVEIDKTLIPILHETLASYDNVEVINEDIMIFTKGKARKLRIDVKKTNKTGI